MLVVPLLLPAVSEDEGWQSVSVSSSTQTSEGHTSQHNTTQPQILIRSDLNQLFLWSNLPIERIRLKQIIMVSAFFLCQIHYTYIG